MTIILWKEEVHFILNCGILQKKSAKKGSFCHVFAAKKVSIQLGEEWMREWQTGKRAGRSKV